MDYDEAFMIEVLEKSRGDVVDIPCYPDKSVAEEFAGDIIEMYPFLKCEIKPYMNRIEEYENCPWVVEVHGVNEFKESKEREFQENFQKLVAENEGSFNVCYCDPDETYYEKLATWCAESVRKKFAVSYVVKEMHGRRSPFSVIKRGVIGKTRVPFGCHYIMFSPEPRNPVSSDRFVGKLVTIKPP